ncbi:hypothetical protein C6P40_002586 [Pichia californica]|uniref:Phosphatase PP2A regulatory subunit A/Splicing factor 3B subunit 1-like HEAT repeat domain-containing protein n=1 Tax=Pichia californica TaxID=460514 RepID=A0A9P7BF32_9ASCO|nr:hypothetical protein C6P40_002586 [[Candida] californica]
MKMKNNQNDINEDEEESSIHYNTQQSDINEDHKIELYHKRDRTPTRQEKRNRLKQSEDQIEEQNDESQNEGDKTPPRSEKRGRKRKLDALSSDNNDNDDDDNNKSIESIPNVPIIAGIPLISENLDKLLPTGFNIIPVPSTYKPLNNLPPDFTKFDSFINNENSLLIPEQTISQRENLNRQLIYDIPDLKDLQFFSESDFKIFHKLIEFKDKKISSLSTKDQLELKCMKLILKIKNCSTSSRKLAMRNLTDNAKNFGPEIIFSIILPLLSDPSLDEQGRHLLIKIVGRIVFRLDDSLKPFTEKILIVIMPLLVDDNKIARLEGRDVITKLSKAVGLFTMINVLRPDLNNNDEYSRALVSRTFAVVANSLGINSIIPFLKAICKSKKEWLIRHTGVKIIQQIAILSGSGILPYLNQLVNCIYKNLNDPILNVRTITASTISSLAEASSPYGFETFELVIEPLWKGLKLHRGKGLAQFIRALGNLIPLMNIENSNFYSFELLKVIRKELTTTDDDMKRAILIIIEKICSLETIEKSLILKSNISDSFFKNFWSRRVALDKKIVNLCINACYSLSLKIGTSEVILAILPSLKDESEPYRRMGLETCDKVLTSLGCFDLDDKTIHRLLDGLLYCFQNQQLENKYANAIVLNSFGNIVNNLGIRVKPHIISIISAILYRLKNKDAEIREQAADLVSKIVDVLNVCNEEDLLVRLCTILYESLGEVYPNVLGSILCALRSVILSIKSVDLLNPSISQILSTLTPILRNRHEKVQEMIIPLIGDIADRAKEYINHREWMRISFELLEMLKAYKKSIRKSANKTFGLIAKAIGPADVLVTLLNNLRVQERQLRVSTAVAIGIVADVCLPFSVLPALMNEYRYPDKNVQNGVLKAIGFMFEYVGELGSDYIYATTPLLLDALTDRDLVHRQIASNVIKHMALGSYCHGYEDAFINFLDLIWPNIFETSPHVIAQVFDSIESLNLVLGSGILLDYVWAGLFHPARKVRESYWKIYNNIYTSNVHAMIPYYPRLEYVGEEPGDEIKEEKDKMIGDIGVEELDFWI